MPAKDSNRPKLHIRAPARLHLGFLDPDGCLGRRFGSIGMAISEPATEIIIETAARTSVAGCEQNRTAKLIERFSNQLGIENHYAVTVEKAIPAHAGLGSGTQLALAIGAGLIQLDGHQVTPHVLGALVERGARSAIGITSFEQGGFIVDGGKGDDSQPPPVIARIDFPEDWRIVLALDRQSKGVHGKREAEAFRELEPFPEADAAQLCHLTAMKMLPALLNQDISAFGDAVAKMQARIGRYFAPVQGGSAWSSRRVENIVRKMGDLGAQGIGQSSWGPTGFAFVENTAAAERLYRTLVDDAKASGVDIVVVKGRNHGATIQPC